MSTKPELIERIKELEELTSDQEDHISNEYKLLEGDLFPIFMRHGIADKLSCIIVELQRERGLKSCAIAASCRPRAQALQL